MLSLLLFLVLNHSVMAEVTDSDDASVGFGAPINYALLLGGLLALLAYGLIWRSRRKSRYERPVLVEEEEEEDIDDSQPIRFNSEVLQKIHPTHLNSLVVMYSMTAMQKMAPHEKRCMATWEKMIRSHAESMKAAVANKSVTMDVIVEVLRHLATGFAAQVMELVREPLEALDPWVRFSIVSTRDELMRRVVSMQVSRSCWPKEMLPNDTDEQIVAKTRLWAEVLAIEGHSFDGIYMMIENYTLSLVDDVSKAVSQAPAPCKQDQTARRKHRKKQQKRQW
ncbi:unnamed protein product, partial [Mesorhabditis spiculigera]